MSESIVINGQEYLVQCERVMSRYARASLRGNTIRIRVPRFLWKRSAAKAYEELKQSMIKKIEKHGPEDVKMPIEFTEGTFSILGRQFNIEATRGSGTRSSARFRDNTIKITLANSIDESTKRSHTSRLARRALAKALSPLLTEHVMQLNSAHFKSKVNRITLRDNSTLWGSCSPENNIMLDFRLLFAPQDVMDAVIIHELAHTVKKNHSKAFWKLVTDIVPDYKEKRRWLKQNSFKLMPNTVSRNHDNAGVSL